MFNPHITHAPVGTEPRQYVVPDMTDIASWGLTKLEIEYKKLDREHKRLLSTMERLDKSVDARVVAKLKDLSVTGRAMYYEIEKKKAK